MINNQTFDKTSRLIYFVKEGVIIASLKDEVAPATSSPIIKKLLAADVAFRGTGMSFLPMDGDFSKKIRLVNNTLQENKQIYLFTQGRIIPVALEELSAKSALIRAYLQTASGYFTENVCSNDYKSPI